MTTAALIEGWEKTRRSLRNAQGIAWDGCHKIYVLMDEPQMAQMREYGYGEDGDFLIYIDHLDAGNPDRSRARLEGVALATLREWFDDSCGLRFINAVETIKGDPNDGFTTLIGQFDDDPEDDPDIYGWGSYDDPDEEDD